MKACKDPVRNQKGVLSLGLALLVTVVITIVGITNLMKTSWTRDHIASQSKNVQAQYVLNSILEEVKNKMARGEITMTGLESGCWRSIKSATGCTGSFPLLASETNYPHPEHFEVTAAYRSLKDTVAGAPAPLDGLFELKALVKDKRTGEYTQGKATFANYNLKNSGVVTFLNSADAPVTSYPQLQVIVGWMTPPPDPGGFERTQKAGKVMDAKKLSMLAGDPGGPPLPPPPPPPPESVPIVEEYDFHLGTIDTRICPNPDLEKLKDYTQTFEQSCLASPQKQPIAVAIEAIAPGPCGTCTSSNPVPNGNSTFGTQTFSSEGLQSFSGATVNLVGKSVLGGFPKFSIPTDLRSRNQAHAMKLSLERASKKVTDYFQKIQDLDSSNNYRSVAPAWLIPVEGPIHGDWQFDSDSYTDFSNPMIFYFDHDAEFTGRISGYVNLFIAPKSNDPTEKTTVIFRENVSLIGTIFMSQNTQIIFEKPGKVIGPSGAGPLILQFNDATQMPLISAGPITFARSQGIPEFGSTLNEVSKMGQIAHTRGNGTFDLAAFDLREIVDIPPKVSASPTPTPTPDDGSE